MKKSPSKRPARRSAPKASIAAGETSARSGETGYHSWPNRAHRSASFPPLSGSLVMAILICLSLSARPD